MPASSNMEKLKEAYRVWDQTKGKDQDIWLDLMAEEVIIRSVDETVPGLEFAKNRRSRKEAAEYLASILSDWKMVEWKPETFVEEGDRIAMFGRCAWESLRTGKQADGGVAHLVTFEAGKIVDFLEIFDSAKAMVAAMPD